MTSVCHLFFSVPTLYGKLIAFGIFIIKLPISLFSIQILDFIVLYLVSLNSKDPLSGHKMLRSHLKLNGELSNCFARLIIDILMSLFLVIFFFQFYIDQAFSG
jgi:hypothetical protein